MTSNSGSPRQLARKRGLTRVKSLTVGVASASMLSAVGIAVALARPPAAVAQSAQAATTQQGTTTEQGRSSDSDDDDFDFGSQLQRTTAPRSSNDAPHATSGGS